MFFARQRARCHSRDWGLILLMSDRWFVRVGGKEYGPVDFEILAEWKREGRLLPGNELRRELESTWMTAAAVPGLFHAPTAAAEHAAPSRPAPQFCRAHR